MAPTGVIIRELPVGELLIPLFSWVPYGLASLDHPKGCLWTKPSVVERTQTLELNRLEFKFQVHCLHIMWSWTSYFISCTLNFYTRKLRIIPYTIVSTNLRACAKYPVQCPAKKMFKNATSTFSFPESLISWSTGDLWPPSGLGQEANGKIPTDHSGRHSGTFQLF